MFKKMWTDGLNGLPEYLNDYQLRHGCFDDDPGDGGGGGGSTDVESQVDSFSEFSEPAGTVSGFDPSRGEDVYGGDEPTWGPPADYEPAPLPADLDYEPLRPDTDEDYAWEAPTFANVGYAPSTGFLGMDPAGYGTSGFNPYAGQTDFTGDLGALYGDSTFALGEGVPTTGEERAAAFGEGAGGPATPTDTRRLARATTYLQQPFQRQTRGGLSASPITTWAEWGATRRG